MNRALVDTDILSYYFKGDKIVVENFRKYIEQFDLIEISLITYYEIVSGLLAKNALKQLNLFDEFISGNLIVPMTEKSARISSEIYSTLKQSGKIVDDVDLFIAGIAIENDIILATNNDSHFSRIPGLIIENWKTRIME
jgi:tRNA(fMet)-specific endonuclease VapC